MKEDRKEKSQRTSLGDAGVLENAPCSPVLLNRCWLSTSPLTVPEPRLGRPRDPGMKKPSPALESLPQWRRGATDGCFFRGDLASGRTSAVVVLFSRAID